MKGGIQHRRSQGERSRGDAGSAGDADNVYAEVEGGVEHHGIIALIFRRRRGRRSLVGGAVSAPLNTWGLALDTTAAPLSS